jgi:hypothetical protein
MLLQFDLIFRPLVPDNGIDRKRKLILLCAQVICWHVVGALKSKLGAKGDEV